MGRKAKSPARRDWPEGQFRMNRRLAVFLEKAAGILKATGPNLRF